MKPNPKHILPPLLTLEQELAAYKQALADFEAEAKYTDFGFCHYFKEAQGIAFDLSLTSLYRLFLSTSTKAPFEFWFERPDRASRIAVLREVIKNLEKNK